MKLQTPLISPLVLDDLLMKVKIDLKTQIQFYDKTGSQN